MPKRRRFGEAGGAGAGPKNSSTAKGRSNDAGARSATQGRTAATARRLKMYTSRATRDSKGRLVSQELQSSELPSTRIVPDRRWFGNTRTVGQAQLERFREEVGAKVDDPYTVLLKERKLPLGLLADKQKHKRVHLLDTEPFEGVFGKGATRKRPKLALGDYEALADAAGADGERFAGSGAHGGASVVPSLDAAKAAAQDGHGKHFRAKMFDKGQSGRIWGELYKVVDSSDVLIQVLDARDPEGTRCHHLEAHLRKEHKHKHLILLLNKCDLVPAWVARRWMATLSKEYPTLAFHATQGKPFGKGALLGLLRQLARLKADKQSISVGMVGYPNVGKSSVINTLRDKKVCPTAPVPGETKVWRYVSLMRRINLIDCPGVVYNNESNSEVDSVLKGVVRIDRLEDATEYITDLLARVKRQYVQKAYKLRSWLDAEDFLAQVAQMSGKMLPGGEADLNTAARMVLTDWQRGRLPYFTTPPELPEGHKDTKSLPLIPRGRTINTSAGAAGDKAGKDDERAGGDPDVAAMPEINQPLHDLRAVEGMFDPEDERPDMDDGDRSGEEEEVVVEEDAEAGAAADDGAHEAGSDGVGDEGDADADWDALMQSVGVRKPPTKGAAGGAGGAKGKGKQDKSWRLEADEGEGRTGLEAYADYSDGDERDINEKKAAKKKRRMVKRRRQGLAS